MMRHRALSLAWVAIASGIAVLLFVAGASEGIYRTPVRVLSVALAGVYLVAWLLLALWRPDLRPRSALAGPLAAALAALGVAALGAIVPRLALDYLAYAVLLAGLYLLLVRLWAHPGIARRLGTLCVILTAGIGVLYVIAIANRWVVLWSDLGRFIVPPLRPGYEGLWFGNPNALAPILMLLYLTAVAELGLATRRLRILFGMLGLLVAVDVLLSGSRGAWVGVAVAALTGGLVLVLRRDGRAAIRAAWFGVISSRRARSALALASVIAVIALVVVGPSILSRINEPATDTRTIFWAASLRMFEAHPLTGIGPGAWAPLRPAFTLAGEVDYYIPHAHNLELHVLAELGVVGVVAAVVVCVGVLRLLLAGLGSTEVATRRAGWIALLAIALVLGQHLVDEYVHQPAVLFAIALPIAKLDSLHPVARAAAGSRRSLLLTLVLLGAVVVAVSIGLLVERAAGTADRAVAAADEGRWDQAVLLAAEAVREDPNLAPYRLTYGLALAQTGALEAARDQLQAAASLDDYPESWLALGAVEARLGNTEVAVAALEKAMRLGEQQPQVAAAAADVYRSLGQTSEAEAALARAFVAAPSMVSDPFWQTPDWALLRKAALALALADAPAGSAAMIAIEAGDSATAREVASEVPGRQGQALVLAAAAIDGDASAFADLHEMATATPLDTGVVGICLRTAELLRAGSNAVTRSTVCDGVDHPWTYPVVTVGTPAYRQSPPGPDAPYHAVYAYRRSTPFDMVPGWLPHLVVVATAP
jgi:O-antigen ligase